MNSALDAIPPRLSLQVTRSHAVIAIASILLSIICLAGLYVLAKSTGLPVVSANSHVQSKDLYPIALRDPSTETSLAAELKRAGLHQLHGEDQVLETLKWTMSQTTRVSDNRSVGAWALLQSAKNGEGFICGDLADLLRESLVVLGLNARRVHLLRNLFDVHDTHVAVEVWLDGRWQLFDPTFHITLETENGQRVNAAAAQAWFIRGVGPRVTPRFLGEVPYPARIATYPLRYEAHFNNVFYETKRGVGYFRAAPIVGALFAPEWVYEAPSLKLSHSHVELYRMVYFFFMVVLPLLVLLMVAGLIASLWQSHRVARRR
jgi:hypothetical protein